MLNKKLILIFLVLFGIITLILLFLTLRSSQKNEIAPTASPTPFVTLSPTRSPLISLSPSPTVSVGPLRVVNILPLENINKQQLPIQFITITFNYPIHSAQVVYNVDPFVQTTIKDGDLPNQIVISPKNIWQEGITTITISVNTTAVNGTHLQAPVTYKIFTAFPTGGE
ncbi:MAG TPA: hypothetical protein VLF68_03070 [Candidatus Saccharimonadales bacterium]|nr:hypothetical protein [Candidatus Saccharimonadales bacterium]